ncbi:class I tRNA ligase family protein [Patescibacteria group bacterium]|nr:class I tRNA ligase family protein [Patescibacteria group bacterium]
MFLNKFYITTPIYYVNAEPHIGHAYTTIAADILARYHRMKGDKVFFSAGTDEHGIKIEKKAKQQNKKPKQFTDEISAKFQLAFSELNITNNCFTRTTEKKYTKVVQKVLQYMYNKGDIYLGKYEGLYCVGCEQYKSEKDLINNKCPDHQIKPEKVSEETYLFRMSKYQDVLLKKIETDEFKIRPISRKNEIISFYKKEGLKDISFSRKNVKWGIPLPWDKKHTAYVWADAFVNYLTALGWQGFKSEWKKNMWPPDIHLMGKDILRVHATIWPAMLLSLNVALPKLLFSHGFFLVNGQKMSKTIGNVITPDDLIEKYGVDATRYLLISATSFGHDGDINLEWFDKKYNADLANGLGNLVARSIKLAQLSVENKTATGHLSVLTDRCPAAVLFFIQKSWTEYEKQFNQIKLDEVIKLINKQIKYVDNYITVEKPWELIKNKNNKISEVLCNILEHLRHITLMVWPFMPETAEKIYKSLGLDCGEEMKKKLKDVIKTEKKTVFTTTQDSPILFPRI